MKKLIFLALLCLSFAASHAALIFNKTTCSLQITPVCYDPVRCTWVACGPAIPIPGGGGPVPVPVCNCNPPQLQGYIICYSPGFPRCAGLCTNISDAAGGPCPNFPIAAVLPPCPDCLNRPFNVFWDPAGDLIIQ